jgi:hypothetical protein
VGLEGPLGLAEATGRGVGRGRESERTMSMIWRRGYDARLGGCLRLVYEEGCGGVWGRMTLLNER